MNIVKLEELEGVHSSTEKILNRRIETFNERTDHWKDSYKGEHWKLQTESLRSILQELENVIDALKDWNEEN